MRKLWINVLMSYCAGTYFLACFLDKLMYYIYYMANYKTGQFFYAYPQHLLPTLIAIAVMVGFLLISLNGYGDWWLRLFVSVRKPLMLKSETDLIEGSPFVTELNAKTGLNVKFWVQESPQLNGFAWGKNNIAITTAVLERCNISQRDAVIMHEVGHLIHNDTSVRMANMWGNMVYCYIGRIFINFYHLFNNSVNAKSKHYQPGFLIVGGIMFLLFFGPMLLPVFICWIIAKFNAKVFEFTSKEQEFAADDFAARNDHKNGLVSFLKVLSATNYKKSTVLKSFFESHPSPRERINRIAIAYGVQDE